ncbi:acyl-CoA dehydrogenase family protein [Magnetospirillum sp. 15-1]|uniref:acyl-CoA dehydrogenase family protein n=1 Tax=Magnetospirillum sp. 15-1 TaxID=1979370 RepID=UPI000BBC9F71|nr:acyl-CoA dehydrogenase family protein [Magnetospirillum sp. 15-1]
MSSTSLFYTADHEAFRDQVRRFVAKEIEPNANKWEDAEEFPRDLFRKAADVGILQVGYPEEYGGVPTDRFYTIIVQQELARCGAAGVANGLVTHTLAMPSVAKHGSEELKSRVLPDVLAGEKIAALACTEPSGGSDVANTRTTARRDGDHYILRGEKTFITSGMRADYFTVVCRTGGPGGGGISLLLLDGDTPGLARTPLKKMGWSASDTATLYFDDCRVPVGNLIGEENKGFKALASTFNDERISLSSSAIALARCAYDEARAYAEQRITFGVPLIQHQAIRHKLVDMAQRIAAAQAFLELTAWKMDQGLNPIAELSMVKNQASQTLAHCASEGVQIFGGAGYLRGAKVERIFRDVKPFAIGGGGEEIIKDLIAKQLGL